MSALYALAAFQALSALQQAEQMRSSADLTRRLNEINAKYADYDSYEAEKFGFTEAAAYEPTISATVAAQQTGYAAQGVDISFGTAAEVQAETKIVGALNVLEIQNRARAKAAGFKREAMNIRRSGSLQQAQAEINANATTVSGLIGAGMTGYRGYTQGSPDGLDSDVLGKSNKTKTSDNRGISSMSYWGRTS